MKSRDKMINLKSEWSHREIIKILSSHFQWHWSVAGHQLESGHSLEFHRKIIKLSLTGRTNIQNIQFAAINDN